MKIREVDDIFRRCKRMTATQWPGGKQFQLYSGHKATFQIAVRVMCQHQRVMTLLLFDRDSSTGDKIFFHAIYLQNHQHEIRNCQKHFESNRPFTPMIVNTYCLRTCAQRDGCR